MTAPRLTPTLLQALREGLTARDALVLAALRRLRYATTVQLQRLWFTEATPSSNARHARRVLRRLEGLRLVARLDRRIGGVRAGSAGTVWALDVAGLRLTAPEQRRHRSLRRPWTPSAPAFIPHHLGVTELYVRIVEGDRAGLGELVDYVTEPACWRRYVDRAGAVAILKPDALITLGFEDFEERWFLEYDRGTESPAALGRKLDAYRTYWGTGEEQARYGVMPRVLLVVPDERRHRAVIDTLARQPAEAWTLFAVALDEDAPGRLLAGQVAREDPPP